MYMCVLLYEDNEIILYYFSFSPPELRGYRCREESLLPVGRPLGPEQPAGSSVQSHPLEKDGELTSVRFTTLVEDVLNIH